MTGGTVVATGVHIGGFVRRRDGSAVPGAAVSIAGRGNSALTDAEGRFVLVGVPEGKQSLAVRLPGGDIRECPIEVPVGPYEITVD
jgi:iron complex outermembrane recepter protein